MANKEKKQLFTGARARLLMNGQRMGWAADVSGERNYIKEPVEVLDNVEVEEHATLGYRVTMSASLVCVVTRSLVLAGLLPAVGKSSEEHLKNIITLNPFVVQIEDNQTGKPIYEFHDCEISSESFRVGARSILMQQVSMVGIRVLDVAET